MVTLSTQLTAPPTWSSDPVKSKVISLPALRAVTWMRTGLPVTPSVSMKSAKPYSPSGMRAISLRMWRSE